MILSHQKDRRNGLTIKASTHCITLSMRYEPASATDRTITWPGYHIMDYVDATNFTVSNFIAGQDWLESTSLPYDDDFNESSAFLCIKPCVCSFAGVTFLFFGPFPVNNSSRF